MQVGIWGRQTNSQQLNNLESKVTIRCEKPQLWLQEIPQVNAAQKAYDVQQFIQAPLGEW